jgi:hypothetical protein
VIPVRSRRRAGGRYLYICEDGLVHYCVRQISYFDNWRGPQTIPSTAPADREPLVQIQTSAN